MDVRPVAKDCWWILRLFSMGRYKRLINIEMPGCNSKSIPAGQPEGYILAYSKTELMDHGICK
jgi:hypothetical protein